jgi:hypothetical protein
MKKLGWCCAIFFGLIIIGSFGKKSSDPPELKNPRLDAAIMAVYAVKKAQRNPDSFVLEKAIVTSSSVCLQWRGQNGFGGMNRGNSVVERSLKFAFNDNEAGFRAAWNRECANKAGEDLTRELQAELR